MHVHDDRCGDVVIVIFIVCGKIDICETRRGAVFPVSIIAMNVDLSSWRGREKRKEERENKIR